MTKILSGLEVREKIKEDLKNKISRLFFVPKLCIIQIGDRADSSAYIKQKQKFGNEIGVEVSVLNFKEDVLEAVLVERLEKLNQDSEVKGIIIQLPIPDNLNKAILDKIDFKKDVDGLTSENQRKLYQGEDGFIIPATARAILNIFDFYNIQIQTKKIAVLGRSDLVGKPTAFLLEKRGGLVSVIHSKTENPKEITKVSDIIVVAIGKQEFIDSSYLNQSSNQVIIDVGIHRDISGKLVGDVNFSDVSDKVFAITPVPGGVGPLTVSSLFQNLIDLC